jgi:hypothetical protein
MSETGLIADIARRAVFAAGSERIGQLVDLYADSQTGAVVVAGVAMIRRGRLGACSSPPHRACLRPASVTVRCGKELACRGLSVRRGETLPVQAEPALFAHYDIPYASPDAQRRRLTQLLLTDARTRTALEDAA